MTVPPLPTDLLDAARELATQRGADFTIADLAAATGRSRATLYRQIGSLAALKAALASEGLPVGDAASTRARILAAARVCFGRQGMDATLDAIAAEAGVGIATVYRQFRDRNGLVEAFFHELGPRKGAREAAGRLTGDLRDDLYTVALGMLRGLEADQDLMRLAMIETLKNSTFADRMDSGPFGTRLRVAAVLEPHVRSGALVGDPVALAGAFGGLLMVFGFLAPLRTRVPVHPAKTARFVTDLFLDGARSRP